ncbi:MAG TPA: cyclase family protein [Steroidobacteraceae bacterium]|jgi:kynurenine formamidase|nr:cyclase family protein [Steroidobacteraceae bacterium]
MARNDRAQWARLDVDGVAVLADLAAGVSLARPLHFEEPQLRCFGAPAATSQPLRLGHLSARVSEGASCNASLVCFAPHAHGTHTECVGHLTAEPLAAWRIVPQRLLLTVLVSLRPTPEAADPLLTRAALLAAWPHPVAERLSARAAVIRTLPNEPDKFVGSPTAMPPYLSAEAASELVARGIAHLVLDVPSADRLEDGGTLTAHRIFFGLPAHATALEQAQRADCTITELAFVADCVPDGWYLLSLQAPCIDGDAVPSRPVLYPLRLA